MQRMRKTTKFLIASIIMFIVSVFIADYFSIANAHLNGAPQGSAGDPYGGKQTCRACHYGFAPIYEPGLIQTNVPNSGYIPGTTYTITATIIGTSSTVFGFEVTSEDTIGNFLGTLFSFDNTTSLIPTTSVDNNKYITHTYASNFSSSHYETWTFGWIAPPKESGSVTFYGAFNVANGDGYQSYDTIYTSKTTLYENTTCIPITHTQSSTLNSGQSITVGTHIYSISGTYIDALTSSQGCDSIVTTHLTVLPIKTVSVNGSTITANQTGATYQWLNCTNSCTPISGATNQNFTPTSTGSYAVVITLNSVSDTSASINITLTGINKITNNNVISVYPNPASDQLNILLNENFVNNIIVSLSDISGKELLYQAIENKGSVISINISELKSGIYLLKVNFNDKTSVVKFVKK